MARNEAQAEAFGFEGTPGFIVGTFRVPGVVEMKVFKQIVADARAGRRSGMSPLERRSSCYFAHIDRIPVFGIITDDPLLWRQNRPEALFQDERVRQFEGIARSAKRKLEAINAASRLEDLTIPPSNRLEKLKGA